MEYEKEFFPVTLRAQVPGAALPATQINQVVAGADHLGYIDFYTSTAGIVQTAGVRIFNNGALLYPAVGSMIDASAGLANTDGFGGLPPLGVLLRVPFYKKLRGGSNVLTFEFYYTGAALITIDALIACYSEVRQKLTGEKRAEMSDLKTVEEKK